MDWTHGSVCMHIMTGPMLLDDRSVAVTMLNSSQEDSNLSPVQLVVP